MSNDNEYSINNLFSKYYSMKKQATRKINLYSKLISECDAKRNDCLHAIEFANTELGTEDALAVIKNLNEILSKRRCIKDSIDIERQFENMPELAGVESLQIIYIEDEVNKEELFEEICNLKQGTLSFYAFNIIKEIEKNLEIVVNNLEKVEEVHRTRMYAKRCNEFEPFLRVNTKI